MYLRIVDALATAAARIEESAYTYAVFIPDFLSSRLKYYLSPSSLHTTNSIPLASPYFKLM